MATRRVAYGKVPTTDEEELSYGMGHPLPAAAEAVALNTPVSCSPQKMYWERCLITLV